GWTEFKDRRGLNALYNSIHDDAFNVKGINPLSPARTKSEGLLLFMAVGLCRAGAKGSQTTALVITKNRHSTWFKRSNTKPIDDSSPRFNEVWIDSPRDPRQDMVAKREPVSWGWTTRAWYGQSRLYWLSSKSERSVIRRFRDTPMQIE